jgi:hypothetical protein
LSGKDGGMSAEERVREMARAGLSLTLEDVERLHDRFEEVEETTGALRRLDVSAHEPYAVFAPEPEDA